MTGTTQTFLATSRGDALVEQEKVLCTHNTLGTATNRAIHKYMNAKKVPHLYLATGASKWGDCGLGRRIAVIERDHLDLAAVDAALVVDHVDKGEDRLAALHSR